MSGGEARRLLPPGSRLKFYDQSFTGEEFKRVSSEGVFHQVTLSGEGGFHWVIQFVDDFSSNVGVEAEGYFGGNYHRISRR